jgi:hypothetical protein
MKYRAVVRSGNEPFPGLCVFFSECMYFHDVVSV